MGHICALLRLFRGARHAGFKHGKRQNAIPTTRALRRGGKVEELEMQRHKNF